MDYLKYKVEDFVLDQEFRKWVFTPDTGSNIFWEQWIASHPEKLDTVQSARDLLLSTGFKSYNPSEEFEDQVWDHIIRGIDTAIAEEKKVVPLSPESIIAKHQNANSYGVNIRWLYTGIAASLVLLITTLGYIYQAPLTGNPTTSELAWVTKQNPRGQKSTIILPDGTQVILNAESSLSYRPNFEGEVRKVKLTGEAFFDVVKNPIKPFIVESNHLSTTALGTSFNVDAYPGQLEEVTLISGKVKIDMNEDPNQSELMMPGEKVEFKEGLLKKHKNVPLDNVLWKDGIIHFKSTPFDEGILKLERWYGVTIDVENFPSNGETNFTGLFKNDNLENVLESLSYVMRFDFKIDGKNVSIKFK